MHFFQFRNIKKCNLKFNLCIIPHTVEDCLLAKFFLKTIAQCFFSGINMLDKNTKTYPRWVFLTLLVAPHMWEHKHSPVCSVKWWTNRFIWIFGIHATNWVMLSYIHTYIQSSTQFWFNLRRGLDLIKV